MVVIAVLGIMDLPTWSSVNTLSHDVVFWFIMKVKVKWSVSVTFNLSLVQKHCFNFVVFCPQYLIALISQSFNLGFPWAH